MNTDGMILIVDDTPEMLICFLTVTCLQQELSDADI